MPYSACIVQCTAQDLYLQAVMLGLLENEGTAILQNVGNH